MQTAAALACLGVVLLAACDEPPPASVEVRPFRTVVANPRSEGELVTGTGHIRARTEQSLAFTVRNQRPCLEPLTFELANPGPDVGMCGWRWLDTSLNAPDDVCGQPPASPVRAMNYTVQTRSLAVLFALGADETFGRTTA